MTISQIYRRYKIMPVLQLHQWRVAAVASLIMDHLNLKVDKKSVITACLLHDMGNILKFDFGKFPDFLQPEGKAYWQQVKDDYRCQYGDDEHQATMAIARELKAEPQVLELIEAIGFLQAPLNASSRSYERKISAYSDMRVVPSGVTSLESRFKDLRSRYGAKYRGLIHRELRLEQEKSLRKIEQQIFTQAKIKPEEVTEEAVSGTIRRLRSFGV